MERKNKLSDDELDVYGGDDIEILPDIDNNPDVFPSNGACPSYEPKNPLSNHRQCVDCKYFYYPIGTTWAGKCSK